MNPSLRALAPVALAAAVTAVALPAEADPSQNSLTEQDAVRLAILHNPDARSAGYDVKAAQGALIQAGVLQNPSLFVGALGRTVSPLQGPTPSQFGVTWTIPIDGKRAAGVAAARAALDASKATFQAHRLQLALSVRTAFVTALLDESLLEFAQADETRFQQELRLNVLRYKDGKIAYGDVLKLQVQALALEDALREARAALAGARADLVQLVGEGVLAPDYRIEGELTPPPDREITVPELVDEALARRPDYLAAQAQQDSARNSLTLARRTPIPDLGISADYDHDFRAGGAPDAYDVTLSVPIPLFDRNRGGIDQAVAAHEQAKLAVESLRLSIHDAAVKAVTEWNASRAQFAAYETGRKAAQQSLDISKHAYEVGSGSLLDYLDAEASYRAVESAYRTALARVVVADRNLRFVAGEELQ